MRVKSDFKLKFDITMDMKILGFTQNSINLATVSKNPSTKSVPQRMRFCIQGVSHIGRKNDFGLILNFLDPTSNSKFPKSHKSDSHRSQIECLRIQIECLHTQISAAHSFLDLWSCFKVSRIAQRSAQK